MKLSASLGVVIFLAFIGLQYRFNYTRTTTKQPDAGRVYPLDVHGHVVYLTYGEERTLNLLSWSAGGFILFAGVAGFVIRRARNDRDWAGDERH